MKTIGRREYLAGVKALGVNRFGNNRKVVSVEYLPCARGCAKHSVHLSSNLFSGELYEVGIILLFHMRTSRLREVK